VGEREDNSGARVIVTGAASGIGAATVKVLRERGARVVGLDVNASDEDVLACDVSDQASVDAAVAEAIERLGGLDVLINNAGLGLPQRSTLPPGADARAVIEVNLLGPWRVTAAAYPALRESHGRVVNVCSGLAHVSVPFAPAYCMSKRGLTAYSDTLRYEAGHEINVISVYPGYVRTPIHDASAEQGFSLEGVVPAEPLERNAAVLASAALDRPRRDRATTAMGTLAYALARRTPRRLLDRVVMASIRRQARDGKLDDSPLAGEFARALRRR
jgi:NAD(P)-dependent dehydrogenase (short-subunit alcohol dehydrogenase family)